MAWYDSIITGIGTKPIGGTPENEYRDAENFILTGITTQTQRWYFVTVQIFTVINSFSEFKWVGMDKDTAELLVNFLADVSEFQYDTIKMIYIGADGYDVTASLREISVTQDSPPEP